MNLEEAKQILANAAKLREVERFAAGELIAQAEAVVRGEAVACKLCGGKGSRPAARSARRRGKKGPGRRTCRACKGACFVPPEVAARQRGPLNAPTAKRVRRIAAAWDALGSRDKIAAACGGK